MRKEQGVPCGVAGAVPLVLFVSLAAKWANLTRFILDERSTFPGY